MTRMIVLSIGQVTWQDRNVFNFCLVIIILCCMYIQQKHLYTFSLNSPSPCPSTFLMPFLFFFFFVLNLRGSSSCIYTTQRCRCSNVRERGAGRCALLRTVWNENKCHILFIKKKNLFFGKIKVSPFPEHHCLALFSFSFPPKLKCQQ